MMITPAEVKYYTARLLNRCWNCCKSLENNTKVTNSDYLDGHTLLEETTACASCNAQVDHYAYGASESDHYQKVFETEHPKAAELIQRLAGKWKDPK